MQGFQSFRVPKTGGHVEMWHDFAFPIGIIAALIASFVFNGLAAYKFVNKKATLVSNRLPTNFENQLQNVRASETQTGFVGRSWHTFPIAGSVVHRFVGNSK